MRCIPRRARQSIDRPRPIDETLVPARVPGERSRCWRYCWTLPELSAFSNRAPSGRSLCNPNSRVRWRPHHSRRHSSKTRTNAASALPSIRAAPAAVRCMLYRQRRRQTRHSKRQQLDGRLTLPKPSCPATSETCREVSISAPSGLPADMSTSAE